MVFKGVVHVVSLAVSTLAHVKPVVLYGEDGFTILYKRENYHQIQDAFIAFMRREAEKTLPHEIRTLSQQVNLPFNRLTIRQTKTRWGSCSSQKNINLNWQLIRVDDRLRTYVMIHELCHLVHMDHSPDFWKLVAHHCPEYRTLRTHMKKVNPHWIDAMYQGSFWRQLFMRRV